VVVMRGETADPSTSLRFGRDDDDVEFGGIPPFALLRMGHPWWWFAYSPDKTMGGVGVLEPPAFSMVIPKALAATPLGSVGSTTEA